MPKELRNTVHTALITAFTIAAALIWKDVIVLFIEALLPGGETLLAEFFSAVIATLMVLLAITFILKAEEEVDEVVEEVGEFAQTLRTRLPQGGARKMFVKKTIRTDTATAKGSAEKTQKSPHLSPGASADS